MKTAEEFLSHAKERLMLLKIFGYTPKEDQIKDLCKIMEQFRKEGMKEAFIQGSLRHATSYITEEFEEWYNKNKEA